MYLSRMYMKATSAYKSQIANTFSKFLYDVDSNGILVDFLISLNHGYSEISQLLFNNIHQKFVDTSQTL